MIVWINGAFGAGKTQTAYELHRRYPDSFVYDPENIGYFLQQNIPAAIRKSDFQEFPMWRSFNFDLIKHIDEHYQGIVIVPMTLVDADYFRQIVGKLREEGIQVRHFALCASKDTITARLKSRGEGKRSWAALQRDRCIAALADPRFELHIQTDGMTVEEAAETIAAHIGIELAPRGHAAMRWLRRLSIKLKHVRWLP